MARANPLADLSDFSPKAPGQGTRENVSPEDIEKIATENNFPSRQPRVPSASGPVTMPPQKKQRRYVTGRNQQINIKATAETIAKFNLLADRLGVPLGEVLERAVDALENSEEQNHGT